MVEVADKVYFSVCYDIQRPWNKKWDEISKKPEDELTPEEKKELQRRREWDRLIGRFINELNHIGFRINWSVYLIPERHYDKAKSIVDRYSSRFKDMGVKSDIYILKYHPDSNDLLLNKLKLHMKMKIEKIVKNMEKVQDNRIELKYLRREIDLLFSLAKAFSVKDEMIKHYNDLIQKHELDSNLIKITTSQVSLEDLICHQ